MVEIVWIWYVRRSFSYDQYRFELFLCSYFQLGRCLNLSGKFSDAAQAYQSAIEVINAKIGNCRSSLKPLSFWFKTLVILV